MLLYTGSPDAPTPEAVRRYLKRFLMDPHVLTMPSWARRLLVHGIIAPVRARASAAKYAEIWMPEGSPLVVYTERFMSALQAMLPEYPVAAGAAYGARAVADALNSLLRRSIQEIVVLPMFPHHAGATRGSLLAMLDMALAQAGAASIKTVVIPPFYEDEAYIDAMRSVAAAPLQTFAPDHIVFSYHGLPVRQGRIRFPVAGGLSYEEQCNRSTAALIGALSVDAKSCSQAWQSRFGRGWLEPTLESALEGLARKGCRRVAVLAPSFVTDCLETLEELDMRARERFLAAGGEAFLRIPCLNDYPPWVAAAASMIDPVV